MSIFGNRPGRLEQAIRERTALQERGAALIGRLAALEAQYVELEPVANAPAGSVSAIVRLEAREKCQAINIQASLLTGEREEIGSELGRLEGRISNWEESLRIARANLQAAEAPPPWLTASAVERAAVSKRARKIIEHITGNGKAPGKAEPDLQIIDTRSEVSRELARRAAAPADARV